jgi:hypothetical protein
MKILTFTTLLVEMAVSVNLSVPCITIFMKILTFAALLVEMAVSVWMHNVV